MARGGLERAEAAAYPGPGDVLQPDLSLDRILGEVGAAMDSLDDDVSARVLLKGVLFTEPPRSPVTRLMSKAMHQTSGIRRSLRIRQSATGLGSPQMALRQKLKERLHENVTGSPVRKIGKMAASDFKGILAAPGSPLSLNDITPRGLLQGILRTEPELSPLATKRPVMEDRHPGSSESGLYGDQHSTGTSDLDLPDLSTVNLTMAVRGISRKRPQRNIDLSTFERRLDQRGDVMENPKGNESDNGSTLSNGLESSCTLSLKTPHVDPQTERRGLRRAAKRRVVDRDNFEQGVENRLLVKQNPDVEQSLAVAPGTLSETAVLEKFTLGLTDLTTSDIVLSSTALYPHPGSTPMAAPATASALSVEERDTVTATQIRKEVEGGARGQTEEEQRQVDQDNQCTIERDEMHSGGEAEEKHSYEVMVDDESARRYYASNGKDVMEMEGKGNLWKEVDINDDDDDDDDDELEFGNKVILLKEGSDGAVEEGITSIRERQDFESNKEEELLEEERSSGEEKEEFAESETHEKLTESKGKMLANLDTSQGVNEDQQLLASYGHRDYTLKEQVPGAEHIARQRAYRSEGGANRPAAQVRGFRSLGTSLGPVDTESAEAGQLSVDGSSRSEAGSRSLEAEGFALIYSPDMQPSSPEQSGVREAAEVAITRRGSIEEHHSVQDQESLSPSPQLEPPEPEMSPLQPPTPALSEHSAADVDQGDEEENREDSEGDGFQSEELSMKTPAFVRQKKRTKTPGPLSTPSFLKAPMKMGQPSQAAATKPRRKRQSPASKERGLPKSYIMSAFKHFAKTTVSPDVYPVLKEVLETYFSRLSDDLEMYAAHAKRKTIEVEDIELLLRRQGFVTDSMPVNVLIERYLPQEYRKLLIPVATSGNKVVPTQRR